MRMLVAIVILSSSMQHAFAQNEIAQPDSFLQYFRFEDPAPLSCLFTYFPPFFIQHGMEMKSFISSTTFRNIRKRFGDDRAVDAIYIHAMQLTNNNTAIALLLSAIACFNHRTVGLKVPIFQLFFPLSDESEEEFTRRVRNLPSRLYSDTPTDRSGDHDKLQHFFGSTFLAYTFETQDGAERIGDSIEEGEDAFVIGGVNDERDKRANRQGRRFAAALFEDNHRLPSEFLQLKPVKNATPSIQRMDMYGESDVQCCIGDW
jgi:hypothetical protein